MALLRFEIHAPRRLADEGARLIADYPYTANVARYAGASIDPPGDVVTCDVPREAASALLDQLEGAGLTSGESGVVVSSGASHLGTRACELERQARGEASDALLWPVVEDTIDEEVGLSVTFLACITLATVLAAVGIVTNSVILLVGAMVVGPEFGPIAHFCVSLLSGRHASGMRAWGTVAVGFATALACTIGATLLLRATTVFPEQLVRDGLVNEVASPGWLTLLVAMIAGVVGMLALTSARSAPLMGVLISITTVPAAADAALLLAYGRAHDALPALATLAINLTGVAAAGIATLAIQRRLVPRLHRLPT